MKQSQFSRKPAAKNGVNRNEIYPRTKTSFVRNGYRGQKLRGVGDEKFLNGLRAPSQVGKNFVLDTNVLLHDPDCVRHFGDNHVCVPLEVLCELDRFKTEQSERGANARAVHRNLTELFSLSPQSATQGIPTDGGGSVRLVVGHSDDRKVKPAAAQLRELLPDIESADHRILFCAKMIGLANTTSVVLVTKDLNLQLKAHALGLPCEDYLSDKVESEESASRQIQRFEITANQLQRFASSGRLELSKKKLPEFALNEYVLLSAGEKRTMPARFAGNSVFERLRIPESVKIQRGTIIRPLNLGQQCFMDALLDDSISMVTCYGQAGTGKTLLAVASALHATLGGDFTGLTVSRPVVPLGETLGFLPGALDEKLDPWLKPIFDALEFILAPDPSKAKGKKTRKPSPPKSGKTATGGVQKCYQPFLDSGLIEVEALCYIRGRSIPNRFFILDEAQQLTPLEAKTIVTRMARGSKLVMVGDPEQIDNPYVDRRSNGLVFTRDRLKNQSCAAHVTLEKGERSELAEVGARLM